MKALTTTICLFFFIVQSSAQRPCNLYCDESNIIPSGTQQTTITTKPIPGKRGPPGDKGDRGDSCHQDCFILNQLQTSIENVKQSVGILQNFLPRSCEEIHNLDSSLGNGVYHIQDSDNISYPVYCDMVLGGGGWTLVASIHENNIRSTGRCTTGDRWSSENGHESGSQVGAESWMDHNIFGHVSSATSDDYKNQGYFDLSARDIMIWQVPNKTPLSSYSQESYLQYHTTDGFLNRYGGNLYYLFTDYFPIKSGVYTTVTDNGPAIPVTYDRGAAAETLRHFGPSTHPHVDAGYIQFRVINYERSAYALCPGTRAKSSHGNSEHSCIGSTADNGDVKYCGDFAALIFDGYGTGEGWNADMTLIHSTFLIFYR